MERYIMFTPEGDMKMLDVTPEQGILLKWLQASDFLSPNIDLYLINTMPLVDIESETKDLKDWGMLSE